MAARRRARRRLHPPQQRVHLGLRQPPPGPDAAVASHAGDHGVEPGIERSEAVEIRVADSGIGIEPDDLERIFELFHQLDATLDRAAGGLGIGLAMVFGAGAAVLFPPVRRAWVSWEARFAAP